MTIVFIPALVVVLLTKERETGRELTHQEDELSVIPLQLHECPLTLQKK